MCSTRNHRSAIVSRRIPKGVLVFLEPIQVLSGQREYIRAAMPVLEGAQLFEAVAFSACVLSGCGGYYAYDHICHDDESHPPPPQGTPWDRQKPPSVDATTAQEAE